MQTAFALLDATELLRNGSSGRVQDWADWRALRNNAPNQSSGYCPQPRRSLVHDGGSEGPQPQSKHGCLATNLTWSRHESGAARDGLTNFVSAKRNQSAGKVPRPDEAVMRRQQVTRPTFEGDRQIGLATQRIGGIYRAAAKCVKVKSNKATNKSHTARALATRPERSRLTSQCCRIRAAKQRRTRCVQAQSLSEFSRSAKLSPPCSQALCRLSDRPVSH